MAETTNISPMDHGNLKGVLMKSLPKGVTQAYRAFKEGMQFPLVTRIQIAGLTASFEVHSYREKARLEKFGGEEKSLRKVISLLDGNSDFLDIGSHVGMYTIFAALKGAHVMAIEPEKVIFQSLKNNTTLNGIGEQTLLVNCAAGQKIGKLPIFSGGVAAISPSVGQNVHELKKAGTVEVKKVDEILASSHFRPDVVKIDVEGMEVDVLRGMIEVLSAEDKPRHMFVEIHPMLIKRYGGDSNQVFEIMKSVGYDYVPADEINFGNRRLSHFTSPPVRASSL